MESTRKHSRYGRSGDVNATVSSCDELGTATPQNESGDFIDCTIAIWQKRTERKLSREDGREIIENITGFFSILQEWERKERAIGHTKASHAPDCKGERRARRNRDEGAKSAT